VHHRGLYDGIDDCRYAPPQGQGELLHHEANEDTIVMLHHKANENAL
jgi:hypothetical protein